ncbi:hypothetical protein ACFQ5D_02495 [Paenibacillus farraposensis]|uniref:Rhs family protein n=2 Tax=Paenibacillus farraposensis TaxID=2807095 RepID=A0ABW4D988_9BACL|nr:hypothetical protein [Paenibacillus farraposensis]
MIGGESERSAGRGRYSSKGISSSDVFELRRGSGEPYQNHKIVTGRNLNPKGEPNTSVDLYNKDGVLTQRRYYGSDGRAQLDIDYDHSNADGTHTFPHRHEWDWTQKKPRQ